MKLSAKQLKLFVRSVVAESNDHDTESTLTPAVLGAIEELSQQIVEELSGVSDNYDLDILHSSLYNDLVEAISGVVSNYKE